MWAFLADNLLWWHWIALGIILITIEIFTGTFLMLGLGVAAMLVGGLDNLLGLSLGAQLGIWILFSVISILLWFKYLKDYQSNLATLTDYQTHVGVVTQAIAPYQRGKVKFETPILGNTLWHATAPTTIPVGSKVKITNIKGQLLEVEKVENK